MSQEEEKLMAHLEAEYIKYKAFVDQACDITRAIIPILTDYYTDEKLMGYKTFDDVLDDLNWLCPDLGVGKLIAIGEIKERYKKLKNITE